MVSGVRHKSVLQDTRLKLTRYQEPCRVRRLYVVEGIGNNERTLKLNDPDVDTLAAALLERMYYCKVAGKVEQPYAVDPQFIHLKLLKFKNSVVKNCKRSPPISPEQFVEMYRGRKRTIYENALNEYYEAGVQKKHSLITVNVKCEKVPEEKAPRCIQFRSPVYNIGLGVYLKAAEKRIYTAIGDTFGGEVTVVKGYNMNQVGQIVFDAWHSFEEPVAVGLDATKFDMHVSKGMLQWEHSVYKAIYNNDPELSRLLRWQLHNFGTGYCDDGRVKYDVEGRRMSGDMNTGLGNCLIMCAAVWTYAKEREVPIRLLNNGDDCQVLMERVYEQQFMQGLDAWFKTLGFRMTQETPVYTLPEVEFCQMRCIIADGSPRMVRNIDTAREKDSMSLVPLTSEKLWRKWLYAVGECGLALCSGVPIMQSLYMCYMRHGVPSQISDAVYMQSGARMLSKGMESKYSNISNRARVDVFEAWGFTPDEQVELEKYYDTLDLKYAPHPVIDLTDIHSSPF